MSKRITKGELDEMRTLGALNPVGHAVLAFESDAAAADAKKALLDDGFEEADVLGLTSSELFPDLTDMMRNASGAAGFGYEIVLMRRYLTLASAGAGWLVVFSPDEEQIKKVAAVARKCNARSAAHYGRLASEDLI
ncbi:MAG: hypothetical protein ABI281_09170 [Caldimonas sp.]